MSHLNFWKSKLYLMWCFAWMQEWKHFWEEWSMTYQEMQEAEAKFEETNRAAVERLLKAIEEAEKEKAHV